MSCNARANLTVAAALRTGISRLASLTAHGVGQFSQLPERQQRAIVRAGLGAGMTVGTMKYLADQFTSQERHWRARAVAELINRVAGQVAQAATGRAGPLPAALDRAAARIAEIGDSLPKLELSRQEKEQLAAHLRTVANWINQVRSVEGDSAVVRAYVTGAAVESGFGTADFRLEPVQPAYLPAAVTGLAAGTLVAGSLAGAVIWARRRQRLKPAPATAKPPLPSRPVKAARPRRQQVKRSG